MNNMPTRVLNTWEALINYQYCFMLQSLRKFYLNVTEMTCLNVFTEYRKKNRLKKNAVYREASMFDASSQTRLEMHLNSIGIP